MELLEGNNGITCFPLQGILRYDFKPDYMSCIIPNIVINANLLLLK